jgi:broad specificity phosphatase PhoE
MNKITQPQDGDVQLSELGHQCCEGNVEEILETLKSAGQPYVMLISPAKRTRQTANYFKANASVTFSLPELLEVDFGDFSGKPEDHAINGFTMGDYRNELINGRTNFRFPNGESIEEVSNRVKKVLARVTELRASNTVVIVGHNRFFRHLELEYRKQKTGEYYYQGMFGNEFVHASLYDIDASFTDV